MRHLLRSIRRFLSELRRRNVYQVAVTYIVVGFFVIEAADLTLTRLGLPGWTVTLVVVLVGLGFPIALVMAWALEVTPEGVRVEEPKEDEAAPAPASSPRDLWVGASVLALLLLGAWWLWGSLGSGGPANEAESKPPEIDERSIAVLPFEALGQEKPSVFTEGMHDDLLTRLSNVSDLKVISRTAVRQYRGTDLTTGQIADSLGVRWVLEGAVQEMGDRIQVNAQLIDPRSETHVWAEDYQRDLTAQDLFGIQGDITRKIADALQAQLTPEEQERAVGAPTKNLDAYRLYVKGRRLLAQRGPEELQNAVRAFEGALKQDSTYALAWTGLADALGLGRWFAIDVPESVSDARTAARRAIELDPDLGEAHASMGFVHILDQDGPAALRALGRAVELKPSYAQAQHWLGALQLVLGRVEPALRHLSLAVELSPHHKTAREWLASAYLAKGNAKLALREARQARRNTPNEVPPVALLHLGKIEKAREVARKALATSVGSGWEDPQQRAALAIASVAVGDSAQARKQIVELEGNEATKAFARGVIQAALGEKESALAAFERVENWGILGGSFLTLRYFYPEALGPLRDDTRYETLIREINQQWGLNSDGSIPEDTEATTDLQSDA